MSTVRVVVHDDGVQDLLKSTEMQALLKGKADAIAAAAGPGMQARVDVGRTRAHAVVITDTLEAIIEEAAHRKLTRAIDAGRG